MAGRRKVYFVVVAVLVMVIMTGVLGYASFKDYKATFIQNVQKYSLEEISQMSVEEIASIFCWEEKTNRYFDRFFNVTVTKEFYPWERKAFLWRIRVMKFALGL